MRVVNVLEDVCGLEWPRETRPSRPAVELVEGCEERLAGNHVDVEARLLVVPVFVGEGALGPVSLRDAVLLRSQLRDRFGVFPVGRHSRYSFSFCIEARHRMPLGAPGRRVESIIWRGRERLAPGPARRTVTNAARRGPAFRGTSGRKRPGRAA